MRLPYRILVLQDNPRMLSGLVHLLRDANYLVTGAATTDAAKRLLALGTFDLLITNTRVGTFTGSNLVRQASAQSPEMAVLMLSEGDAPTRSVRDDRQPAEYDSGSAEARDVLAQVSRCLRSVRRPRRWERKPIGGAFRVLGHGVSASVIDVCYGGLRLEFNEVKSLPELFDVEIAGIGLHLPVEIVWHLKSVDRRALTCGVALAADTTPAARTWRAIVDRL